VSEELRAGGLTPGSVVALALPNRLEFVSTFFALARLGSTILLLSPRYGSSEVTAISARARPDAWLVATGCAAAQALAETAQAGSVETPRPCVPGVDLTLPRPLTDRSPLDPADAVVKFSSGSTGEPKGVRLEARGLLQSAAAVAETLELREDDRVHARVPLFHSYGFDLGLLAPLFRGASVSVGEGFIPRLALRELGAATVFLGVPSMYRLFLETKGTLDPAGLRWALSCTAPLSVEVIEAVHQRYGVIVSAHYGASECGAITNHLPAEVLRRPTSVGRAVHGVSLALRDELGAPVADGDEGELLVGTLGLARGLLGYDADELLFEEGPEGRRYRTSDLGRIDDDGYLTLLGRRDQLINIGGLKVSPVEVESVLESHPAVREALVREQRGASGEAFVSALVTLRGQAAESELIRHCHGRLADHKIPRRVESIDVLPRTPGGKLDRRAVGEGGYR